MVLDAVRRNELYLRLTGRAAQFLGLFLLFAILAAALLLLSGVVWVSLPTKYFAKVLFQQRYILYVFQAVFSALFLLGISQFINCLIEVDFRPKWILRNGDKLIYVYICFFLISSIFSLVKTKNWLDNAGHDTSFFMVLMAMVIFAIIRMFIWIAFALILKKILPIIQESKTRV